MGADSVSCGVKDSVDGGCGLWIRVGFKWQLFKVWVRFGCDCLEFGLDLVGLWVYWWWRHFFFLGNFGGDEIGVFGSVWLSLGVLGHM